MGKAHCECERRTFRRFLKVACVVQTGQGALPTLDRMSKKPSKVRRKRDCRKMLLPVKMPVQLRHCKYDTSAVD